MMSLTSSTNFQFPHNKTITSNGKSAPEVGKTK